MGQHGSLSLHNYRLFPPYFCAWISSGVIRGGQLVMSGSRHVSTCGDCSIQCWGTGSCMMGAGSYMMGAGSCMMGAGSCMVGSA